MASQTPILSLSIIETRRTAPLTSSGATNVKTKMAKTKIEYLILKTELELKLLNLKTEAKKELLKKLYNLKNSQ